MRFLALTLRAGALAAQDVPVTGTAVPGLSSFDDGMLALLKKYNAPGASLAVTRDGRLILARGYGWADAAAKIPVQPDSLFRLASLSKTFTATAIMKLAEDGKLSLDRPALDILDQLMPAPGQTVTPAFTQVTVRELLWHAGGWDRDIVPGGYDPMFQNTAVTKAMGVPSPATCTDIIRWMLNRPLDFAPGQRYAYSNFGYCILGRIIEKVSGQPYETYLQQKILAPLGIGRMSIGSSLLSGRKPNEVKYYDYPGAPLANSVFPQAPGKVPEPDGGCSPHGTVRRRRGGNQPDLGAFTVLMGDQPASLLAAGPSPDTPGVDIVQAQVPDGLADAYDIVLRVDGKMSNALHVGQ